MREFRDLGPTIPIIQKELRSAKQLLHNKKTIGPDDIPAQIQKLIFEGRVNPKILHLLFHLEGHPNCQQLGFRMEH